MRFTRSVLVIAAASQLMFAQGKPAIAEIWRGQSSCTQKESACREETVVYRFSENAGRCHLSPAPKFPWPAPNALSRARKSVQLCPMVSFLSRSRWS
jgi:hypothetical protein